MTASYQERLERFNLIERVLSTHVAKQRGLTTRDVLERLVSDAGPQIVLRTLQRDLEELRKTGRIGLLEVPGKSRRYVMASPEREVDALAWEYTLAQVKEQLQEVMTSPQLQALLFRLIGADAGYALDQSKLRIISDTMRLKPAAIHPDVLVTVLSALAKGQILQLSYRDRGGKVTQPQLHPQGLLQRGPRVYLFALKNDENEVRMYTLHRMIKAEMVNASARKAEDFDLEHSLYNGQVDFAGGEQIKLEARVRGYVADLLRDCPLNDSQTLIEDPENSEFEASLTVQLPESGQLLRWLLGCGDNLQVLGPDRMRNRVCSQARKMAALYD